MKLISILKDLDYELIQGNLDKIVKGVEDDSRKVLKDYIFIAVEGFTVDGHDYINNAISNGASVLVVTKDLDLPSNITIIKVKDDKEALAQISSSFYKDPSTRLNLIGITGTNGKTSITYILKSILETDRSRVGLIGTMGSIINEEKIDNNNTTPESLEIQKQIAKMLEGNTDYCLMEVSSHSLDMKRVDSLDFDIGLFTNLTEDHLDYHKNMEEYFNSKKKLFYKTSKLNIINLDDPYGKKLIDELKENKTSLLTYGLSNNADIYASEVRCHNKGVDYKLNILDQSIDIQMNLLGEFNVYNAIGAATVAFYYGYSLEEIKYGLENIRGIKGRFELVPTSEDFSVIIDFAHTPDGLEKLLKAVKNFSKSRIIVIFGAGGNRDKIKRPIMGEVVGLNADIPIVTSDNPRYEDPESIVRDVVEGVKKVNENYIAITDRKEAIKHALQIARKGDTIILAGKGHETYIQINGETIPFDEEKIVVELLEELRGEN